MKLGEIATALGCRLQGDRDLEITGVLGMEDAAPGHLTFLANPKYGPKAKHTKASAILVSEPAISENKLGIGMAILISATLTSISLARWPCSTSPSAPRPVSMPWLRFRQPPKSVRIVPSAPLPLSATTYASAATP